MNRDEIQEMAALYAAGALAPEECAALELQAAKDPAVAALLRELAEIAAGVALANGPSGDAIDLSTGRARLRLAVEDRMPSIVPAVLGIGATDMERNAVVVTDLASRVRWLSPAFTEMCGHDLTEVRGVKLGPVLQGPDTDKRAVAAMRDAVHGFQPITQEILNYHKNGSPYLVQIRIEPVTTPTGAPLCFVALEKKLE